jgi:diguanylate cyclase (GGDEF)-like protein
VILSRAWLLAPVLFLVASCSPHPEIDLSGQWKWKTGDTRQWSEPDLSESDWLTVDVPNDVRDPKLQKDGGYYWLRTSYKLDRSISESTSLELGVIAGAEEVFVDGIRIGSSGRFPPDPSADFHRMRAYPLPPSALTQGEHRLAVRIHTPGGPGIGILREPVGLSNSLRAQQTIEVHRFFRSDLLVAAALATFIVGLYHLFIWLFRRRESQYLLFTSLSVTVAVYMFGASFRLSDLMISHLTNLKLAEICSFWASHFLFRFVRVSLRKPLRHLDNVSLIGAGMFTVAVLLQTSHADNILIYSLWFPILLLVLAYSGYFFSRHLRTQHGPTAWAVAGPFVLLCFSVVHDVYRNLFDIAGCLLNPYAFCTFILGISYFLAKDYSRALADRSRDNDLEKQNIELKNMAYTDELTQLPNRRRFELRLEQELERARRYGGALSLALIDVDHFKLYNDRFGHPAGDRVLREVGWILKESVRSSDLAARIGGEEFAMILPETNDEDAVTFSRRLRSLVESFPFENVHGPESFAVTVSIGIAHLTDRTTTLASLVEAADRALYKAKQFRNTVFSTTFSGRETRPKPDEQPKNPAKIIPIFQKR